MSEGLNEAAIETFALKLLSRQGYDVLYGPDMAPDGATPERASYSQIFLTERMRAAARRINTHLPVALMPALIEQAVNEFSRVHTDELLADNETLHRMLTEGVTVSYQEGGAERGALVWLIDFAKPDNNEFLAVNQFTVEEKGVHKRPDVVLFVNGIPLVVVELKNAASEKADMPSAFRQIETYKAVIPSLFASNAFVVISDGLSARAGTLSSGYGRFMAWKSADGIAEASHLVGQLEVIIQGMLNPATLLDLVRHFIVFEKMREEDAQGIITIRTVKKLAAYHQYYAVNAAVASTLRAAGMGAAQVPLRPVHRGMHSIAQQPAGDRKAGVVWHTQGSGKSLSMVFYAGKIVLAMDNPTLVVLTDRNDLDDQLFGTFAASRQLLRQDPVQAKDREDLRSLLSVPAGGVIFSTIQKFQPEEGNIHPCLTTRQNVVVIADEAHRSQYGFAARSVDEKDKASGAVTGQRIVYGLAKYLRDALPNATYLGFTGTPIEKTDVNTPAVFGNYVDIYDIAQAVEDRATVPIYYESRLVKVALSDEGRKLIEELDEELLDEDLDATQKAKAKRTRLEALIGSEARVNNVARDVVAHFEARQEVFFGKGLIVTMSRPVAAAMYAAIVALRPDWHSDELRQGKIKVVMTGNSSDGPELAKLHTTAEQRRTLAARMKDDADPLQLVIVCDMWLTGFDVPSLHTMYIDKPMKGHTLMQAIARVNRVYKDKPAGLIVDYLGFAADLKEALAFYADAGGQGDPALVQEEAVALMLEKLEVLSAMLQGVAYEAWFDADTAAKLALILTAEEHILGLDNGRERFIREVTALSKAFAIAVPHEQAMHAKDEVALFQAIKARLAKFGSGEGGEGSGDHTDEDIETTIRQVIDKALVSDTVVDVFDAAGIKRPDISILSEEFLAEMKDYQHKNIALEVLKKLLADEIRNRSRTNLVQSKKLMEMLESAIRRYQNKVLTAAEVIEELIHLSKEITESDNEAERLGLTDFEYAFYTAVAGNDSARELMGKDKLRELAVVLTQKVRENATLDWTKKESVRARLMVAVKRTLRLYGYPPDMQMLATETVLKQAEMIAGNLV